MEVHDGEGFLLPSGSAVNKDQEDIKPPSLEKPIPHKKGHRHSHSMKQVHKKKHKCHLHSYPMTQQFQVLPPNPLYYAPPSMPPLMPPMQAFQALSAMHSMQAMQAMQTMQPMPTAMPSLCPSPTSTILTLPVNNLFEPYDRFEP